MALLSTRANSSTATSAEPPADRAMRLRDKSGLGAELQVDYDAILQGFERYEAGDDEAARTAVQAVGLGSPFLEWKLLLRGLIAYSTGDDGRAIENWQRLSANRLPARLAAPLRAALDPGFATAQTAATAALLSQQLDALSSNLVTDALRAVRPELAGSKPLAFAFRKIEPHVPTLRRLAPHLVPKLANCLYRAIQQRGDQTDLARFRKLFGPPHDDPEFHRLEAQVYEENGNFADSIRRWSAYEAWLAKDPPGWPAELVHRTRAAILYHIGKLIDDEAADPHEQLRELMSSLLDPSSRKPGKARAEKDPGVYWRKAVALAPSWEAPARDLFAWHLKHDRKAEAEAVARRSLTANPNSVSVLRALAGLLIESGRAVEALELRTRALGANPLVKTLRFEAAYAYLAAARSLAIEGRLTDSRATLLAGEKLCEEEAPIGYFSLRAVLARKSKQYDEAERLRSRATEVPGGRLAAVLHLSVDSMLLKLKPAERKAAEVELAAALAEQVTPIEALAAYRAVDQYALQGIKYRGQKTHEKKVQEVVLRTTESESPDIHLETLARAMAKRGRWKLVEKLSVKLTVRFPGNPVFRLLLAEAEFEKAEGFPAQYRVIGNLKEAEKAAMASPEPRHRALLDRIRELLRGHYEPYGSTDSGSMEIPTG